TTLDVTRHGDTSGLDLTVGHVSGCEGLDAVLAEADNGSTGGLASAVGTVLLAVLDSTWNKHGYALAPSATGASARGARRGRSLRSGRVDLALACSRASSLLVMSPL